MKTITFKVPANYTFINEVALKVNSLVNLSDISNDDSELVGYMRQIEPAFVVSSLEQEKDNERIIAMVHIIDNESGRVLEDVLNSGAIDRLNFRLNLIESEIVTDSGEVKTIIVPHVIKLQTEPKVSDERAAEIAKNLGLVITSEI